MKKGEIGVVFGASGSLSVVFVFKIGGCGRTLDVVVAHSILYRIFFEATTGYVLFCKIPYLWVHLI
jgi:hypothetical protein